MARSFQKGTQAVISVDTMATRFENMLNRVSNMIKRNNIYSVWIRLTIGKSDGNKIIFDTSSQNKDENLMMSLDYEKVGAGIGNKFTFKVAFDLFNYGQETKKNVEKLDELIYRALNVEEYENAIDYFYCNFQYGYNVVGDTQIVSPFYEGLITEIVPSVDYSNGKTYYTISGSSMTTGTGLKYSYDQIGNADNKEGRWNGLDLVQWILWYYHGNPDTVSQMSQDYSGNIGNQHQDVKDGIATKFNIDIPKDLIKSASLVYMEKIPSMTPIDYCKEVLNRTVNTSDSKFNGDITNPGYNLEEGDFKPYYTIYITDSGGSGIPTIHVAYIGSNGDLQAIQGLRTINFEFEWFSKTNNIVIGWQPQVDLMSYFAARAEREHQINALQRRIDDAKSMESVNNTVNNVIDNGQRQITGFVKGLRRKYSFLGAGAEWFVNRGNAAVDTGQTVASKITQAGTAAAIAECNAKIKELSDTSNIEYYKSKLTLVGIPSDIPLNIMLQIKPKIFESISRTQGKYYVLGAKDTINTNGLFVTSIDLVRYKNINS